MQQLLGEIPGGRHRVVVPQPRAAQVAFDEPLTLPIPLPRTESLPAVVAPAPVVATRVLPSWLRLPSFPISWPGRSAPGAVVAPPVVVEGSTERMIPLVALGVCLAGIGGLVMPVLAAANGLVSFATLDIPYVGMSLMIFFVLVGLLPVIDLTRRRLRLTAWLLVPGLMGLIPALALVVALRWLLHLVHLLWAAMPDKALEVGPAPLVLAVADVALVVIGTVAVSRRFRMRRERRRLRREATAAASA